MKLSNRRHAILRRPDSLKTTPVSKQKKKEFKWFPYVETLFTDLRPSVMFAQQFYFIHILRRIVFVLAAIYL
jgi:hypothetical protein